MAESEDSSASPDSTTRERFGFVNGEDVLLQHKDGKFYLGTIVEVQPLFFLFEFSLLNFFQCWKVFLKVNILTYIYKLLNNLFLFE